MPICTNCNASFLTRVQHNGRTHRLGKLCLDCKPLNPRKVRRKRPGLGRVKPPVCLYHHCQNNAAVNSKFCCFGCENKFYVTRARARKHGLPRATPEVLALYLGDQAPSSE